MMFRKGDKTAGVLFDIQQYITKENEGRMMGGIMDSRTRLIAAAASIVQVVGEMDRGEGVSRHSCGEPWSISSGPGRVVGAVARSITGVSVPLPDDFTFEYCAKCSQRNMTPELEARFLEVERAVLNNPRIVGPEPDVSPPIGSYERCTDTTHDLCGQRKTDCKECMR